MAKNIVGATIVILLSGCHDSSHLRSLRTALLTLVIACRGPDVPVPLYHGEWIDIAGVDREPTDACVGTFEYVDAYAGVVAAEFGVDAPLGTFVWYTRDAFDEALPCGDEWRWPWACTIGDTVHSAFLPDDHELVHAADYHAGDCPNTLGEGIAVYYSSDHPEGRDLDTEVLLGHLRAPYKHLAPRDYEMMGRFAAFLVEKFGLEAVLDVCVMAGGHDASGEQLAQAMESILGMGPEELVAALSNEPSDCNHFRTYRSKVFECGSAAAARDFGIVSDDFETTLDMGCDRPGTVPSDLGDQIRRTFSFELPADGVHLFRVDEVVTELAPAGLVVEISRCGFCEYTIHSSDDPSNGWTPLLFHLDAGRYSLELRLPADFSGTLRLQIDQ